MLLITSAAYITPGLVSEFGKLPPSMLPVQNRRLYEHQIELVKNGGDIVLSLPKSYNLTNYDKERLTSLGVKLVFVPDEFSLGQSVVYVLNVVGDYSQDISILHGDTLFSSLPNETDICAVAKAEDCYEWDVLSVSKTNIFSGYFAFSNQTLLIQKITESSYNFIDGVRKYYVEVPIKYI